MDEWIHGWTNRAPRARGMRPSGICNRNRLQPYDQMSRLPTEPSELCPVDLCPERASDWASACVRACVRTVYSYLRGIIPCGPVPPSLASRTLFHPLLHAAASRTRPVLSVSSGFLVSDHKGIPCTPHTGLIHAKGTQLTKWGPWGSESPPLMNRCSIYSPTAPSACPRQGSHRRADCQ